MPFVDIYKRIQYIYIHKTLALTVLMSKKFADKSFWQKSK